MIRSLGLQLSGDADILNDFLDIVGSRRRELGHDLGHNDIKEAAAKPKAKATTEATYPGGLMPK